MAPAGLPCPNQEDSEMSIGLLFWVLFVIAIVFGAWGRTVNGQAYWANYNGWVFVVLLFLLGWRVFGFVIQG
jgi:hypothetical protein